ncbi:MAG: TetR/AcrR family transcriptional regulator [Mycobacteriales bacterium]
MTLVTATTERGQRGRRRILDAAREALIAGNGRLELAALTAAAGVSTGAVYHHFGSRAGVLTALVDEMYAHLGSEVLDVEVEGGTWAGRERERIRRLVRLSYAEPLAGVLFAVNAQEPALAAADARHTERLVAAAAANVRRAQRHGELSLDLDPDLVGAMVMGGIRQVMALALTEHPRRPEPRLADQLWSLVAALVTAS